MKDPVQNLQLSLEDTKILKALIRAIHKINDPKNPEGVNTSSKFKNSPKDEIKDSVYFTAKELADHFGISEKTVYYRSAPKSANPFPFKVLRIGGSKRGRLRFKKLDVYEAERKGVV